MPMRMPISASSRLSTRPQLSRSKYFQTKLKLRWYCTRRCRSHRYWITSVRPSRRALRALLRMRGSENAINGDLILRRRGAPSRRSRRRLAAAPHGEGTHDAPARTPSEYREAGFLLRRFLTEEVEECGGVDLRLMT